MLRIPLGEGQHVLLLAPSWSGWQPVWQGAALAASLLVPLALVLALYRWELRLVARRAAVWLVALRVLGLALVWSLAALQPMIAHEATEETPSRVLLAVDLSGSMSTADPQRTWLEKLELARALGLDDEHQVTPADLAAALAAARQGAAPKGAAFEALARAVDRLPRGEIARRLLAAQPGLLERLRAHHEVHVVGFSQTLLELSGDDGRGLLPADPTTTAGTNLTLPLQRALEQPGSAAGKLLGVVLVTDGRHNDGTPPASLAKSLGERAVPIYAVALGSRQPPVDLAVLEVKAPAQVFKDAEAALAARLRVHGLAAQAIKVEMSGPAGFAKQHKIIQHDGKDRIHHVEFPIKLSEAGTQRLEIHARPAEPAQETTSDNNRLATVIRVASDKSRILIVEDQARWEYHYLATALGRDPDLQLDRVLLSPPRLGAVPEDQLEKLGHARRQLPAVVAGKEDPLWQYDGIVLGDVAPEHLPRLECDRLERYVADRGGTLIIIAGRRHVPLDYLGFSASDPLVRLLPIEKPMPLISKTGFALVPTGLGEKTPFFQIEASIEASRQRWAELPRHYWGVVGTPKPGATVLARAEDADGSQVKPGTDDKGLIVQQHYGFGKVVFFGLESTWRWRYRVGDRYHHRFWGQLMRWAVSDPFLPEGNRFVRFGSKAPVYRHDQEAELLMRLGEEAPLPGEARINVIRVREGQADETAATVKLAADAQRTRHFEGKVKLTPGAYKLELDMPELKDKLADVKEARPHGFTVTPPENGEQVDLATDWELLQGLVQASGGRLFTAADVHALPDLLARHIERQETRTEVRPWQDLPPAAWVLGGLILLLTLEWSLRKLAGLP